MSRYYVREVFEYTGKITHIQNFNSLEEADKLIENLSDRRCFGIKHWCGSYVWFYDVVDEHNKNIYLGLNQCDKDLRVFCKN